MHRLIPAGLGVGLAVLVFGGVSESALVTAAVGLAVGASLLWGWWQRQWLPFTVGTSYLVVASTLGLAREHPGQLWLWLGGFWLAVTWLLGLIGPERPRLAHRAFASFLVTEVLIVLHFWPMNGAARAAIGVAFATLLWQELGRSVPLGQRLTDSIIPFLLIVTLMTLTGRWLTF